MSEETKEQKRCESCGQLYPEQRDDFIHYDPDRRGIVCRASFNGLRLTTELAGVTCPKCRLIAAAPAQEAKIKVLLEELKQLLFLWWENLPKCDKPDCFRCKANSIKKKEFEVAIALAEKGE